jgi:diaminopimelate decarboxylase
MGDNEMNQRLEEAIWALKKAKKEGALDSHDSSALFVSWDTLDAYLSHLTQAFNGTNFRHSIAIKTQPHSAVLRYMAAKGFGLEAASLEEVMLAEQANAPFIIFDSPVKRPSEIEYCQQLDCPLLLNVNCLEELERLPEKPRFEVGIRINPQVDIDAPKIYQVSDNESKFGVPISQTNEILDAIERYPVTALHVHSGSSMKQLDEPVNAIMQLVALAKKANERLAHCGSLRRITSLDIGGGLLPELLPELLDGSPSVMENYSQLLQSSIADSWDDFQWTTEFGQWVHYYTGYAVSDVEYALQRDEIRIAFLHLGADFLMRDVYTTPRNLQFCLLDSKGTPKTSALEKHDLAGPLCFAGDYIGRAVQLPKAESGDQLIIMNTGSNAFGLWSRHCSRSIPKVLGVSRRLNEVEVVSKRTGLTELIAS